MLAVEYRSFVIKTNFLNLLLLNLYKRFPKANNNKTKRELYEIQEYEGKKLQSFENLQRENRGRERKKNSQKP